MTEAAKKKPLSLNERHNRLLQDFSASQSKPPASSHFFTCEREEQSTIELGGRRRNASFSNDSLDYGIAHFSGIADFDSPPEKENQTKVKIEGRRRLCKTSSTDDGCPSIIADKCKVDEQKVLEISDFSSPSPTETINDNLNYGGGHEIRNILNDLTSRLEIISIEKQRNPRSVDQKDVSIGDSLGDISGEVIDQNKDDNLSYASAGSSFYSSPDRLSSSSSVNNQFGVGGAAKLKTIEVESLSEYEGDTFAGNVNAKKKPCRVQVKKETKKVTCNPTVVHRNSDLNIKDEKDDEETSGMPESENLPREKKRHGCKSMDNYDYSTVVEISDDDADEVVAEDDHAITLTGPISTFRLPGKISKRLYLHQCDGLRWLWSLHCLGKGGILGDDMGLGKTMQICGFLSGLFHSRLIKRAIIVAPKTLIPHWIKELSTMGLSEKTREYFGTCQKTRQYELQYDKGVLLTTYDIVRNNAKHLSGSYSLEDDNGDDCPIWDYMILDEGHLIKNPSTQRAKSLFEIPCAHRIVISGTPIQNNLKELWALFSFCCPDLLGDKKDFKNRYEYPILRGNEKRASDRERHIGSTVAKELRERIQPYFLRRLKSEVFKEGDATKSGKLSKKNEIIVWLRLTSCQRHLYEAFLNSELVLSAFDGSPLAALTILKKICDHPFLLTKRAAEDLLEGMDSTLSQEDRGLAEKLAMHVAKFSVEEDFLEMHGSVSCKISFILSLLENLIAEGHNVLIFSQTRKMLNLIQELLISNDFEFQRIDGTTKATDRMKIVNDFQEGRGAPIFLLTSQVGGLGLTLTNADRVIVVDPAWNPSTDNQSVDRVYRIGQTKDVIVYRLMTCGTIEEKIYRKQIFKGGLFKTATEHKEQTRYFSQQDLKELFSLPKDGFDISPTQQQLQEEHYHQISMSDALKAHIEFLESLGIGGVSHHSLLYSKAEPPPARVEEEDVTRRETTTTRHLYSASLPERSIDGAELAFKPKDALQIKKKSSPESSSSGVTESDIKERISRLSQIISNKATVSRLPDGGEKIRKQIEQLNLELNNISSSKNCCSDTTEFDNLADELHRSLKV
ncbi:hypothetical protein Nepgr_012242 [Nepenthes gracilis]|uniref:Protein CHROMATIN REMODELING 24 n=1 Tax=Nepenthes gracilis TaxID=150966 RepID=A0AAD3SGL9_NEPGR|nr:hypothetical protein Nepgr_012242 [Nepenthes gracilis]